MEQWTVKDKVCLVTGASSGKYLQLSKFDSVFSGIGLEIARGLAKNGAHLFLGLFSTRFSLIPESIFHTNSVSFKRKNRKSD